MTRIIPRELIRHLEWEPGKEVPEKRQPPQPEYAMVDIESILRGETFYDGNVPRALQQAIEHAGEDGIIASMPELIQAKTKADKGHDFWKNWYTTMSEENIGLDVDGKFGRANSPLVISVHGGGILSTPQRIQRAYDDGLTDQHAARLSEQEFCGLLEGKLPNGSTLPLYHFDEFRAMTKVPRLYGVVFDFNDVKNTKSGYLKKQDFKDHPLAIVRSGGAEYVLPYFEKAKDPDGEVRNSHPFKNFDPNQAQGRLLVLSDDFFGLCGGVNLDGDGRFIGVAPETHAARR